jgi:hypothetical protein
VVEHLAGAEIGVLDDPPARRDERAVTPVGAAWATTRPVSIARSRAAPSSRAGIWAVENEAAFVGTSSTWPPEETASRARSAKKTSQEMTMPRSPAGASTNPGPWPTRAFRGTADTSPRFSTIERNGMNSPKGTRVFFSYESTISPSGPHTVARLTNKSASG